MRHIAKTSADATLPGTWRASCTCRWEGTLHGGRGARAAASADKYQHLEVIAGRESERLSNAERMWGTTHALSR